MFGYIGVFNQDLSSWDVSKGVNFVRIVMIITATNNKSTAFYYQSSTSVANTLD